MKNARLDKTETASEPSALLDDIARVIKIAAENVDYRGNSITFPSNYGTTRILGNSVHVPTTDGRELSDVISIRTELPEQWSSAMDDGFMVWFNTMAALGALVRERDSGRLIVASRLTTYRGDEDARWLHIPLAAFAALLQDDALILAFTKSMRAETRRLDIPRREDPSRWSEEDFVSAAEQLKQMGVFSTPGDTGLTAEIPLNPGGLSAVLGDVTSLLTFQTDMPHPTLGNGLFHKLELPFHFEEDRLVTLANRLNQMEIESMDSPPFFGAWCSQLGKQSRIAFVGFCLIFSTSQGRCSGLPYGCSTGTAKLWPSSTTA